MNKLTAESARQELTKLKVWEKDGVLTLKEERYLQALEIALPILEQQERGEGGWIEWVGGDCPVSYSTIVEVRFRSGRQRGGAKAEEYIWTNGYGELSETGADIIAYRIIPERATNQNGEQ